MEKTNRELLIRDICSRLPYGVFVKFRQYTEPLLLSIKDALAVSNGGEILDDIQYLYLRPMSSMTEEEKKELSKRYVWEIINGQIHIRYHSDGLWDEDTECPTEEYLRLFDWLNKKMFDYRGLIPMGLGLEALKDMYDTKTE